ncbi:MAG: hypothetical protein B6I22_06675 [Desulfobacteraceae bacterium 4572_123]|nr:MAG: hypothetical protein B6I22_06675 [Desulfobacteraceae bacterium 4572_123]
MKWFLEKSFYQRFFYVSFGGFYLLITIIQCENADGKIRYPAKQYFCIIIRIVYEPFLLQKIKKFVNIIKIYSVGTKSILLNSIIGSCHEGRFICIKL